MARCTLFERLHHVGDGIDGGGVIVSRCPHAEPCDFPASVERDSFDLRPADVDTDAKLSHPEKISR